jgi:DNA-binding CsgD family transcriptional regulator
MTRLDHRWDSLLQLLYASAHDDSSVPLFLNALAEAMHASSTSVLVQDPIAGRGNMDLNSLADETYARAYAEHAEDNVLLEAALPHSCSGAVVVSNDYISNRKLVQSEFYRAVCAPFDGHYTMGLCLAVEPATAAGVVVNRDRRRPFSSRDRRFAERLMPHLQTWFRIRQRIAGLELQKESGRSALDALGYGVAVADAQGAVQFLNETARTLIETSHGALVLGRRLSSRFPGVAKQLAEAVHAVGAKGSAGVSVRVPTGGSSYQVGVMPLRPEGEAAGRVVLFIQDRDLAELRAARLLKMRFKLTPAESRVAVRVLSGRGSEEIAQRLGVSLETIKSHLRSVYRKSGTSSKAEFVAAVSGFRAEED